MFYEMFVLFRARQQPKSDCVVLGFYIDCYEKRLRKSERKYQQFNDDSPF
jgi:hypothetical protein